MTQCCVPHLTHHFLLCMCINTEDPTHVIYAPAFAPEKIFGVLKFVDQASILQIHQFLLPPIFLRYTVKVRSVSLRFEADFGSLNMDKTVTCNCLH